jgi:hypothetical protein
MPEARYRVPDLLLRLPGNSGVDMSRFKTSGHLLSFVGLCPRMDESAGKRRDTRIREGNG